MGKFSFLIPDFDRLGPHGVETSHFVGFDNVPWSAQAEIAANRLVARASNDESARFVVSWRIRGASALALSTATLRPREAPYHLPIELARGTINRLRNFLATWRPVGFSPDRNVRELVQTATDHFINAVTKPVESEDAVRLANMAIEHACDAIRETAQSFIHFRRQGVQPLPKIWTGHEVHTAFSDHPRAHVGVLPTPWSQIEPNMNELCWDATDSLFQLCEERRLKVFCGPIIDGNTTTLPDWISLWQDDIDALESFVCRYVAEVVRRYRDRVDIWNSGVFINRGAALNLSEENRLRLTVRALETLRTHDPTTPVVVSLDQPWGEYMLREELEISPFQLADMLGRANIGVSGFALNFRFGNTTDHTLPRDALEFSTLLDRWSYLAKPLILGFDSADDVATQTVIESPVIDLLRTKTPVQGLVFSDAFRAIAQ